MTSSPEALRIWGIWEKQRVEFLPPNERVDIQSWARPDEFVRYGRCGLFGLRADDLKTVSIERLCVALSSCWKTFKLKKVNKSFLPEPISCFRIPIYIYEHFMNIMSISHIRIMGILHFYCSSTRIALVLFHSQRLICHWKKKPNIGN